MSKARNGAGTTATGLSFAEHDEARKTEVAAMALDQALFESLRDAAFTQIKDTLKAYVDAAPDREQLLLVVYISGDEASIDPSTRSTEIEKLLRYAKGADGEKDPEIVLNLRGQGWPTIPILVIRNEPEELTHFQLAWCVYQGGGSMFSKGGDA